MAAASQKQTDAPLSRKADLDRLLVAESSDLRPARDSGPIFRRPRHGESGAGPNPRRAMWPQPCSLVIHCQSPRKRHSALSWR